jgi:VWFA-related protein
MLFQLNFLARDKKGRPVTDLRADEITIMDQGERQEVAFFEPYYQPTLPAAEIEAEIVEQAEPQAAEPVERTIPPPAVSRGRWIVLFFDNYASQPPTRLLAVEAAESWLDEQRRPDDLVAIVSFTGELHIIQGFTADELKLKSAIHETSQQMDRAITNRYEDLDFLIEQMERCKDVASPEFCATGKGGSYEYERRQEADALLKALIHLLRSLGSVSDPKLLVMFSNGFARSSTADIIDAARVALGEEIASGMFFSHEFEITDWYDELVTAAVTSRTSIFTINPGGATHNYLISAERGSGLDEATNPFQIDVYSRSDQNYQASLADMARRTGGTASQKANVKGALREILDLSNGLYSVGYYPNRPIPSDPHEIKIKIKRKGVKAIWPRDVPPISAAMLLQGEMTLQPDACSERGRRALAIKVRLDVDTLMFEPLKDTVTNNFSLYLSIADGGDSRMLHRDYRMFNISYAAEQYRSGDREDPVIEQTLIVPCRPLIVKASAVDAVSGARIDFEQELQP